jgi:hypothetical protein
MAPPFRSNVPIVLTPTEANSLLRVLEDNMPLPPELHVIHQFMITQAHSQREVMHEEHPWISMGDNCALLEPFTVMSEPNLYTHSGISELLTFGQPELWMPELWTSVGNNRTYDLIPSD